MFLMLPSRQEGVAYDVSQSSPLYMFAFSCYSCHSHCAVSLASMGQVRAGTVTCGNAKLEQLVDLCYYLLCMNDYDTKACRPYQDDKFYMTVSFVHRI